MRVVSPKQARDGDGGPVSQIARSAIRRPARAPEGGRRPGHSPSTQHAKAAGSLYEARLRAAVRERWPWVKWGAVRNGIADIEGIATAVLKAFSQRRAEIEEWLAAEGREGRRSAEKAALATRRAKAHYGVETGTWSELMRARAAELGFGAAELAELEGRQSVEPDAVDEAAIPRALSGPGGLTEMRNTFEERHGAHRARIRADMGWGLSSGQG